MDAPMAGIRNQPKRPSKYALILCLVSWLTSTFLLAQPKPRIIVTTDITNEPDDQESLVRLLTYANDYDIEGLIGSTGIWKLCDPATHVIHECIDAYAKVHDNLLLHDSDYPSPAYLHSVTVTGNNGYGMSAVGFRPSKGARLIIDAVDKEDGRPLWCLVWGGANTVAQAIWTVRQERSDAALQEFLAKMRVYDLAAQDDAGAWMAKTFPDLFIIRNVVAYKGMSNRFSATEWDHTRGGDETVVTKAWVKENIQEGHGPLGQVYPQALHIWEGDTPTYFYLMPNGLNDPEKQWQGSWGGRFSREKEKNVNLVAEQYAGAYNRKGGAWVNELPYLDYFLYADAKDKWSYKGEIYHNQWAPIFRWRTDFQHDFAARMDRCIKPYDEVNHNPIAVLNGDQSKRVLYQNISVGSILVLDAGGSSDPDQDKLQYSWWVYPEAGTYDQPVKIMHADQVSTEIRIPQDALDKTMHFMLTLRDDGIPSLTSYRRLVVTGIR